jgi:hypothetical protein
MLGLGQVVLLDPGEPAAGQCGNIGSNQRLQPDVAGFGQEHRAQAQVEIGDPGVALADVAELAGEVGPGLDLQEDLGQVHPGQSQGHVATQLDQAGGLVELVQWGELQDIAAALALDRHSGIGR